MFILKEIDGRPVKHLRTTTEKRADRLDCKVWEEGRRVAIIADYQFLDNLEETNQKNNIIIRIQDITAVQILSGERCRNGWVTFYWMAFSLRNGHIVFSSIKNNNEAKKMEGIVRKYISDLFRCQIKKED